MNIEESFGREPLARLRSDMETAIGRKMYTPRDFNYLSKYLFEKTHQNISSTTFKRLYGYLLESAKPSTIGYQTAPRHATIPSR